MQFIKIKEEKFNIYYHELLAGKVVYKIWPQRLES